MLASSCGTAIGVTGTTLRLIRKAIFPMHAAAWLEGKGLRGLSGGDRDLSRSVLKFLWRCPGGSVGEVALVHRY